MKFIESPLACLAPLPALRLQLQAALIACAAVLNVAYAASETAPVDEVVVTVEVQARGVLGQSEIELSDEALVVKMSPTLGETLANEIGVHNGSYGPGVGLPVLRGLSGVRVRLTEDGIGAWDASSASPDHATSIEPATAKSIRVVKGPATVFHGNNAIGGTVEVINGRIATSEEDALNDVVLELRSELSNAHDRRSAVGKIKRVIGDHLVLQLDGFTRSSGDMQIPGIAIDEEAIGEVFGITNSDNTFGTVLNTDSETDSGSFAASFVNEDHYIGFSTTHLENEYGIPPGAHTEPADSPGHSHSHPVGGAIAAQTRVRIDLEQDRHLFKAGGALQVAGLNAYALSVGRIDYEHTEFEVSASTGDELLGTKYRNDVIEAILDFEHDGFDLLGDGHYGRFGFHWVDREFSARSEAVGSADNFIPASDQRSFGVYAYDRFSMPLGDLELGVRYERQTITQREPTAPLAPSDLQFFHSPITYNTYTGSIAYTLNVNEQHTVSLSLNAAQRAPDIQELLSLGPHLATRSYDIGLLVLSGGEDPPEPEKFYGAELRWQYASDFGRAESAVFHTRAEDFIYQALRRGEGSLYDISDQAFRANCARLEECIAVFDYTQSEVILSGYEFEWRSPSAETAFGTFETLIFGDYVRGRIRGGGDLPRMPPRRQGIGLDWNYGVVSSELRYSLVSAQNKTGDGETATDSYNLFNASITIQLDAPDANEPSALVFIRGKNLLDHTIRNATSFLRNFTPEPGREVSIGLRLDF